MKELKEFTVERLEEFIDDSENFGSLSIASRDLKALAKIALADKQVRTGRSQCVKCGGEGVMDSGGTQPWGDPISVECDCTTPPLNHTEQHMVVPDGWKLVPIEPTESMIQSGINTPVDVHDLSELAEHNDYKNVYSSMLAAAPKPESE